MRSLPFAAAIGFSTLASAQVLDTRTLSTDGHTTQAIWTPDGQHVLVPITRERPIQSGIEVFPVDGAKLKRAAYQRLGSNEMAQGIMSVLGVPRIVLRFDLSHSCIYTYRRYRLICAFPQKKSAYRHSF